jgi:imidazole glycerol phosphate synthase glutamine amidotransferase subunit
MIAVIDYGAGNLHSVCNALAAVGAEYFITSEPDGLERCSRILLPGVGHFGQMMQALKERRLAGLLLERLRGGVPYFGICLGMQALFEASEEAPEVRGFALLPGAVRRFGTGLRVPHMGWTAVEPQGGARLAAPGMYYFAHSYYVPAQVPGVSATALHGSRFAAMIERGNLAGCQFHPEKSGPLGLQLLKRWTLAESTLDPPRRGPGTLDREGA